MGLGVIPASARCVIKYSIASEVVPSIALQARWPLVLIVGDGQRLLGSESPEIVFVGRA